MTELHPSTYYLMLEGLVGLGVLLIIVGFVFYRAHTAKKQTLTKLVDTITRATQDRRDELREQLNQSENAPDAAAIDEAVDQIIRQETLFYQYMINLMLNKNSKPLLELDRQLSQLTSGVINASRMATAITPPRHEKDDTPLSPAITNEIAQIRNDIIKLHEQNDQLLHTIKDLSISSVSAAIAQQPETPSNLIDDVDNDFNVNVEDTFVEEESNVSDDVIDISSDIESLDDFNEEIAPKPVEDDITDIDALLDEARSENTGVEIEAIPDDLLGNEPAVTDNDAITDIDALLDQVAKENVEKSVSNA